MANFNHFTSDSFEEKFNSLFHSLAHGIVYQNKDGSVISANPAALDILGLTGDELMGRTSINPEWHSMKEDGTPLEGKDHPAMVALRTGKPVKEVIMGIYHPIKKEVRWVSIDAHPEFMDGENEPFRVCVVFTDITGKFEVVQKLRESSERLKKNILTRSQLEFLWWTGTELTPMLIPGAVFFTMEPERRFLALMSRIMCPRSRTMRGCMRLRL